MDPDPNNNYTLKINESSSDLFSKPFDYRTPRIIFPDRFIPSRSLNDIEASSYMFARSNNHLQVPEATTPNQQQNTFSNAFNRLFLESTLNLPIQTRVLRLSKSTGNLREEEENYKRDLESKYLSYTYVTKSFKRNLPSTADVILDAPSVIDDFYLNILDWSRSNIVAVALNNEVFVWDPIKRSASKIITLSNINNLDGSAFLNQESIYVTSLKWIKDGNILAVGTSDNKIIIWDLVSEKCISLIEEHISRVSSLAWNYGYQIISSGSSTGQILNHDLRENRQIEPFNYHSREVCGLKWCKSGRYLCTGADDALVLLWDLNSNSNTIKPINIIRDHKSAVKAVDWCPWQNNLLATGGGKRDGKIKIWNIYNGSQIKNIDVNSQISGILWSEKNNELLASNGDGQGKLTIWKYPCMSDVGNMRGHLSRILCICKSPNGEMVASLSADQTLRFWQCFKIQKNKNICSSPISTRVLSRFQQIR